jgi:cation transport ATPase
MTELNLLYGGDNLLSDNSVIDRKDNIYSSKISSQQLHQMALSNDSDSKQGSQGSQHSQHSQHAPPPPQSQSMNIAQQQMAQQMAQQQAQQMSNQQLQQQMMNPQQANEQAAAAAAAAYRRKNEYNFLDRMSLKKTEVIKLALFSLVIVLGISIDRMLTHYLSRYINDNVLTDFQEILLRLSYPITIFLLLWIFKAI